MVINIKGYDVIIDDEDYDKVKQYTWAVLKKTKTCNVYFTYRKQFNNKVYRSYLHRLIIKCVPFDKKEVDHINGNTLDNRKCNLRICTHSENLMNQKAKKGLSGFKGVTWHKRNHMWRVRIRVNYKEYFLGYFTCARRGYAVYCEASAKYHGEFGRIA